MAIDAKTPGGPGWWMQRLFVMMQERNRNRLNNLFRYFDGTPPLVWGSTRTQSAFYQFQRTARTNFAELITLAPVDKEHVRTIRTAAEGDESGDPTAMKLWEYNGLECEQAEVYRLKKIGGESYVSIAAPAEGEEYSTICPEDPRQMITIQDPLKPWLAVAALKLWYDDAAQRDYAYLWLPGQMYVAYRDRKRAAGSTTIKFSPAGYDLAPTVATDGYDGPLSETYATQVVPVVRFKNRDCIGEYEHHLDILDRINHVMLQGLVIATLQAFKQRALEVVDKLPENDPATGEKIDYNAVFEADPGALWELPPGAKIWESGQADMTGITELGMKDIIRLSAVSRTPMSMLMPDSANQTAEGASNQKDGLTSKVEYDQRTDGRSWALALSIAFAFMKDDVRAKLEELKVDWFPAERYSLSEMTQADAASTLPFEDKLRTIYQMTPREIANAKSNRAEDLAFQAALAAIQAPAAPPPNGQGQPAPNGQQQPGNRQPRPPRPQPAPANNGGTGGNAGQA